MLKVACGPWVIDSQDREACTVTQVPKHRTTRRLRHLRVADVLENRKDGGTK